MKNVPVIAMLAAFVAVCARYSLQIELWGDEWASLEYAGLSGSYLYESLMSSDSVHLPTYYLLLKALIASVGESILTLRMIHAAIFTVGLWFGYRTVLLVTASLRDARLVLLFASCIPSFVFYATGLRMYAGLFCLSMAYVYYAAVVLVRPEPTRRDRVLLVVSAVALVLSDLPGPFLLAAVGVLLIMRAKPGDRLNTAIRVALPAAALVVYLPALLGVEISHFTTSGVRSANPDLTGGGFDPMHVAQELFLALRPVWELTSPARPSLPIALGLPALAIGALAASGAWLLLRRARPSSGIALVLVVATYWVAAIPIGYAIPRAFLPAAFFLPMLLLVDRGALPRPLVVVNRILFGALLVSNLALVVRPTLRVASRIPADRIVKEIRNHAAERDLRDVVFLDNTANVRVIERKLRQTTPGAGLESQLVAPGFGADALPPNAFVLVSHIADLPDGVDSQRIEREFGRSISEVGCYVSLDDLPYNRIWKQRILARGGAQRHLVCVHEVR